MLSEELIKLGNELGREIKECSNLYGHACGDILLRHFSDSLDLPNETKLEATTDQGNKVSVYVSRIRKILAGSPSLVLPEGTLNKKEAAIALLRMKIHTGQ